VVAVVPVVAVPADAAQAVIGPDQPAARMVIRGVIVVRIIRVVAAADEEVAMVMVGEAAMMEAAAVERGPAVKGVDAAAVETAAMKAATAGMKTSSMEAAASGMKAASMKASAATMETATTVEATSAAMKAAAATANLGHESVGCMLSRRHDLRCHERHRGRRPARHRNQGQQRRSNAQQAKPSVCNRHHASFSLQVGEPQRSATSMTMVARFSPADLRDHPEY